MDPRFHCIVDISKRENVIRHLKNVYDHIQHLALENEENTSPSTSTFSSSQTIPNTTNENNYDMNNVLDNYLKELLVENTAPNPNQQQLLNAHMQIENYKPDVMTVATNLLDYWAVKEHEFPILSSTCHSSYGSKCRTLLFFFKISFD